MAKEDFCFTYYDGDAARDMAHMTRLERGAYTDILISIRKFGHLTKDQITKILSRDFNECFPAIELVLKEDEQGKYFIEWLENSQIKAKKHSNKQRNNRSGATKQEPNDNQNTCLVAPLGNENEDEDVSKEKIEGTGERKTFLKAGPTLLHMVLNEFQINTTIEYMDRLKQQKLIKSQINDYWEAFKIQYFSEESEKVYYTISDIVQPPCRTGRL